MKEIASRHDVWAHARAAVDASALRLMALSSLGRKRQLFVCLYIRRRNTFHQH